MLFGAKNKLKEDFSRYGGICGDNEWLKFQVKILHHDCTCAEEMASVKW